MAFAQVRGAQNGEGLFERRLIDLLNHFLIYEDKKSRSAALEIIPLEHLTNIAQAKYDSYSESNNKRNKEVKGTGTSSSSSSKESNNIIVQQQNEIRDLLLLELLAWFKTEFFTWMDSPPCPLCSAQNTTPIGEVIPTIEEKLKSASRVEIFTCTNCFPLDALGGGKKEIVARFPRYNDPVVLLKTKNGRCGEWANCFTLICRAVDYETRHVTDWTDHVWVEVYSNVQNRWLHCDPCENSCDNPLLYEKGWGKQLNYIIAVSHDDIQDVTWRYTHSSNHKIILSRRKIVKENWLVSTIIRLRKQKQNGLSNTRKNILEERLINELVEFLNPNNKKNIKDTEKIGRESGSLAWRIMRGEIENNHQHDDVNPFIWKLTNADDGDDGGQFNLLYDCAQDKYMTFNSDTDDNVKQEKQGWKNGVSLAENILRKEENDWKMVYLAREGNAKVSKIGWKFIIPTDINITKRIVSVEINMSSSTFHPTASVSIQILSCDKNFKIPESNCDKNGEWNWKSNEFEKINNCDWIEVICTLEGGTSWQHTQLFRQKMLSTTTTTTTGTTGDDSKTTIPFSIKINFKNI